MLRYGDPRTRTLSETADILLSRDRDYSHTFALLAEVSEMCRPNALLVGFEPAKLKAIIDVKQQDLRHAANTGVGLVAPNEMASNLLKRKRTSVQASSSASYQPIPQQSSATVTLIKQKLYVAD
jgi:hypothetical protein